MCVEAGEDADSPGERKKGAGLLPGTTDQAFSKAITGITTLTKGTKTHP